MHFWTVVNLSFTFSYVNLINIFRCIFPHSVHNPVHLCVLLLPLSMCHLFVHIYLWNQWRYCVSPLVPVLYPFECLCRVWHFTFSEKSHCGKINLVLSVISIITILIKLLLIIFGYVTHFVRNLFRRWWNVQVLFSKKIRFLLKKKIIPETKLFQFKYLMILKT